MGGAQVHPLGGELGIHIQQGHEVGGEGAAPPGGLGADDLLGGDFDDAHLHLSGHKGLVQNLIQYLGIGVLAQDHAFFVFLLALLQGLCILFTSFLSAHRVPPFAVCRRFDLSFLFFSFSIIMEGSFCRKTLEKFFIPAGGGAPAGSARAEEKTSKCFFRKC